MEDHVRDSLIARGVLAANGRGRAVRAERCPRCQRPTLSAWDDDVMAGWAVCDAAPLSPLGEVVALTAGKCTYDLRWAGNKYVLNRRTHHDIAANAPGKRIGIDVIVEHTCGINIAQTLPIRAGKPPTTEMPTDPPF